MTYPSVPEETRLQSFSMVPITVQSNAQGASCVVAIGAGNQQYLTPQPSVPNSLWYLAIKCTTLEAAYNQSSADTSNVPNGLTPYLTSDYILCVVSSGLSSNNVPQGALFDLLIANGAGSELRRLAQVNNQLGCAELHHVSYILLTQAGNDLPGLEESSILQNEGIAAVLTAQLLPIVIDGQPVYTPVELGNA